MIKKLPTLLLLLFGVVMISGAQRSVLFDNDWRFYRGDKPLAYKATFDDANWRKVDLPHDWSIEDIPGTNSPFDSTAPGGVSTGFTIGGTGWYRKKFMVPASKKGRQVVIRFDGVYMNADFWINGKHIGNHPYGYTTFSYDITDHINWGATNTIAVQVKNEGRNSRWYSGSGIYRHVWLSYLDPVHIAQWSPSITTPLVRPTLASINVKTTVENDTKALLFVRLTTTIKNAKGVVKAVNHSSYNIAPNSEHAFDQDLKIYSPSLWSTSSPALYTAVTEVYHHKKLVDRITTPFGIRSIQFDATNGFMLNGKSLKLRGGCVHHDNGALGAKAYDRAEERKVQLLKASGYNAIRTSHNPPSPAFLQACDRLGMLVIDEAFDTWNERKNKQDYHLYFNDWWQRDLKSMVLRDRNHPSVIMWSIGNEIPNRGKDEVAAVAKNLADFVHSLDTTRPVTAGVNGIDQKPTAFLNALDVSGYNYAVAGYDNDHQQFPSRVIYGSESFPLDAYDYWMGVKKYPWVVGDFVWTAFDYIGEASIGWLGYPQSRDFFPWNLAYCGDIDVCGWKRPQSFYRDALWKENQLSLFVKPPVPTFKEWNEKLEPWSRWYWQDVVPNWTWNGYEDSLLDVVVYSSCDSVELFLNDHSLGIQPTGASEKYMTTFKVPYAPGNLQAIGYKQNKPVAKSLLTTAGAPAAIRLTADRKFIKANNQDLSYFTVEITDAKGVKVPDAERLVNFSVEGPATIAGVGNADPKSIESLQANSRTTWQGRCQVILKSTGKPGQITLTAQSNGLSKASTIIRSDK